MGTAPQARKDVKERLRIYRRAEAQRIILIERREKMLAELRQTNTDPDAPNLALDETDVTMTAQIQEQDNMMLEAVELMARLPSGSMGRIIVELRHIEGLSWAAISRALNLSQTPLFTYYDAALDALAESLSAEGGAPALREINGTKMVNAEGETLYFCTEEVVRTQYVLRAIGDTKITGQRGRKQKTYTFKQKGRAEAYLRRHGFKLIGSQAAEGDAPAT